MAEIEIDIEQPIGAAQDIGVTKQQQKPSQIEVSAWGTKLLEYYSKIPEADVFAHVMQVQDGALSAVSFFRTSRVNSIPTTTKTDQNVSKNQDPKSYLAHTRFLPDFALWQSSAYPEILERLQNRNEQFIDIGCGIGQELRQLAADGVPTQNLYGLDINAQNFTTGYTMFKDHSTLNALFLPTSILDHAKGSIQAQLTHKMDILWTSNLLHLLPLDQQTTAFTNILSLMRRGPNALIAGRTRAAQVSGSYVDEEGVLGWCHDVQSFKKMFHDAADRLGEKWETEVEVRSWSKNNAENEGVEGNGASGTEIWFVARKLERIDIAAGHNFIF
jgi:SAM-dependent methyltransferase